jgi:NADH:ubiquinone oxidoreductase subunit E
VKTKIKEIADQWGVGQNSLLQVLLAVQDMSPKNCIDEDAVNEIAHALNISRSRVYSTASFYSAISLKPRGRHIVRVCINAPCENAGKTEIVSAIEQELGIKMGETTPDGQFTLEGVSCLGACYMSPAIKINHDLHGSLSSEDAVSIVRKYREEGKPDERK